MDHNSAATHAPTDWQARTDGLVAVGRWGANYALAIIFLIFGGSKFAPMAGKPLAPLIMHSPLISWMHDVFGVNGAARALGIYEILTGLLLAARPINPQFARVGAAMAVLTFLTTFSFLFTTPGITEGNPFPLTMLGQFLLKDLGLLALAWWTFTSANAEVRATSHTA